MQKREEMEREKGKENEESYGGEDWGKSKDINQNQGIENENDQRFLGTFVK